jgi:uncharacterized protein DUF6146
MKTFIVILLLIVSIYSCSTSQKSIDKKAIVKTDITNDTITNDTITNDTITNDTITNDTIKIENKELEYEIIIIDIGFNSWLATQKPMSYYANNTLAIRNYFNVIEWNIRFLDPITYDPNLYEVQIEYDRNIDYGIEVNYLLFMYFNFFQEKYNQRLAYYRY